MAKKRFDIPEVGQVRIEEREVSIKRPQREGEDEWDKERTLEQNRATRQAAHRESLTSTTVEEEEVDLDLWRAISGGDSRQFEQQFEREEVERAAE